MMITGHQAAIITKYTSEIPVKLGRLAKELGLEVFRSPLKPEISGLIEPCETAPAGFRIRVNRHETAERQRFTLAHEIAHFLLHRDHIGAGVIDNVMYRSNLSSRREVEANRLAADLIMPWPAVRQELAKLGGDTSEDTVFALSQKFRVSQPAMRIRLGA